MMSLASDRPGWRDLFALAPQLAGFPRGLLQHPGGMLVSAPPLTDLVPVQSSAIADRYVVQWDKDSVEDAGLVKLDLLGWGALSQMRRAVSLVRDRSGAEPDLSRIDYEDAGVFTIWGAGIRWGCSRWSRRLRCRPSPGGALAASTT